MRASRNDELIADGIWCDTMAPALEGLRKIGSNTDLKFHLEHSFTWSTGGQAQQRGAATICWR